MCAFKPFANESDALDLDGLNIENRVDRVSIYGDIDLTRDQSGLKKAVALKAILDSIVETLSSEYLPEVLPAPIVGVVKNPFE